MHIRISASLEAGKCSWGCGTGRKGNALVIDIGASEASVTPVMDGFVLRKGTLRFIVVFVKGPDRSNTHQGLAHDSLPQFVRAHAKHTLSTPTQSRQAIQLLPHQLISNKKVR